MASSQRDDPATIAVLERLAARGIPRTSFFTAMQLLERLVPGVRIGGDGPFAKEGLSFRHQASMFSQPNELFSIERVPRLLSASRGSADGWRYELTTCFLGLSGTDSPLPLYFVSELAQDGDVAALQRQFLDLFHNRLTALFYRAVSKYSYSNEFLSDATDAVSTRALHFAGFDAETRVPSGLGPLELLHVAGLYASGPATPRSLENALRALLSAELESVPLTVRELTGGWVELDPAQRNSLGRDNHEAAVTFVIGSRVRHPAHEARVVVGPMIPAKARRFSPGGPAYVRLAALLKMLRRSSAVIKLELHVQKRAFPPFVLGSRRIARDACIAARRDHDGAVAVSVFDVSNRSAA